MTDSTTKTNLKWNILSPDNFPISMDDFNSEKEAWSYFEKWKTNFDNQGYYSTTKGGRYLRIPLKELKAYCDIITL